MLIKDEAESLEKDVLLANKKAMRQILTLGEMVLPKEKYPRFRQSVLNSFGKSGLETDIKTIIEKYTEK
jgi:ribosomal protein L1